MTAMNCTTNERVRGWGLLIGIPAFFALAYAVGSFPRLMDLPLCGVRLFIGIPCPGCGLTHAMAALSHGHLRSSIDWHPMGVVIAGWLGYQFFRALAERLSGQRQPPLLSDGTRFVVLNAFLAALVIQWVARLVIA